MHTGGHWAPTPQVTGQSRGPEQTSAHRRALGTHPARSLERVGDPRADECTQEGTGHPAPRSLDRVRGPRADECTQEGTGHPPPRSLDRVGGPEQTSAHRRALGTHPPGHWTEYTVLRQLGHPPGRRETAFPLHTKHKEQFQLD